MANKQSLMLSGQSLSLPSAALSSTYAQPIPTPPQPSPSSNQFPPPNKSNHNGWTTRGEKLARFWQEECRLYAWLYEQNVTFYSRLNRFLGMASICLSAITGTTLFNQGADSTATSSNVLIGLGVSSIASTILSGIKELLNLNSVITLNSNASRENSIIAMDIMEQLNMERFERRDAREFLKLIKDRKNNITKNGPIIPSRRWDQINKNIKENKTVGFLDLKVFNQLIDQSVDVNRIHYNGEPTDQEVSASTTSTEERQMTTQDKINYYSNQSRCPPTFLPAYHDKQFALDQETDLPNILPRAAARKVILENQYELERILSKPGDMRSKDRDKINSMRQKMNIYRENYLKLTNNSPGFIEVLSADSLRVAKNLSAYRAGNLNEGELYRVIQNDLLLVDNEAANEKILVQAYITECKRLKLDVQPSSPSTDDTQQKLSRKGTNRRRRASDPSGIPVLVNRNRHDLHENHVPSVPSPINHSVGPTPSPARSDEVIIPIETLQPQLQQSSASSSPSYKQYQPAIQASRQVSRTDSYPNQSIAHDDRPKSAAPSDDEFIDNLVVDNFCSPQLQGIIVKNAAPPQSQSIDRCTRPRLSFQPMSPGKYDAEMRYQSSRVN